MVAAQRLHRIGQNFRVLEQIVVNDLLDLRERCLDLFKVTSKGGIVEVWLLGQRLLAQAIERSVVTTRSSRTSPCSSPCSSPCLRPCRRPRRYPFDSRNSAMVCMAVTALPTASPEALASAADWLSLSRVTRTSGGATRALSVLNGLNFLHAQGADAHDWVLVHDAARCLVTPGQIDALIDACAADPVGGLLAHKLPDTLKREVGGRVADTLDRSDKWLAQTPQMFRVGMLLDALKQAGDKVTDESSAMEAAGFQPLLVQGSAQNFKVTYPEDFALAEAVLTARLKGE